MKKRKKGRKLSRKRGQRKSLLKSLIREIFLRERITTTQAKAKEIVGLAEKEINLAKRGDLHSKKLLARKFSPEIVKKLVENIAPRYKERKGGYTRIIKLEPRKSDGAKMAIIELIK